MNKYFIIFVILIHSLSHAQFIDGYGVKIGGTLANQDWQRKNATVDFNPDSRFGMNAGIFMEFLNLPLLRMVTELNYEQKGMKLEFPLTTIEDPDGSSGKTKSILNRVDYLSLAVKAKLKSKAPLLSPYVFAGPRVDFYLNKNVDKNFKSFYDEFKKQVYGLSAGVGAEFNTLPVDLLLELQYNHDLTSAYESAMYDINNQSFDFKIGLKL